MTIALLGLKNIKIMYLCKHALEMETTTTTTYQLKRSTNSRRAFLHLGWSRNYSVRIRFQLSLEICGTLSCAIRHPQIHVEHKTYEEQVEGNESDGLPKENLGAEVDVEEEHCSGEVEENIPNEGRGIDGEGRGVDGDEADDEGGDEGAGGEDGAEAGAVLAGSEGSEWGEDVGGAVAEGEKRDGGHAGGEGEVGGEFGGDEGEVVLGGGDEDVEVEEEE